MKLINDTSYPTRQLRSIIEAVHTKEGKGSKGRLVRWKRMKIRISYRRKGDRPYTGYAYLNGFYCHMSVPRGGLNVAAFIALWRHEMWHLYGIRHDTMPKSIEYCRINDWVRELLPRFPEVLEEKIAPVPTLEDKKAAKLASIEKEVARADARVKIWGTKLKRATTGLKKAEQDAARARAKLERWKAKPAESFERKRRPKAEPAPVPDGHVRIEMSLSAPVGDELRYHMELAREVFMERQEPRRTAWERIETALAPFVAKKAKGGKLVADMRPDDITELTNELTNIPVSEEVGAERWERFVKRLESFAR